MDQMKEKIAGGRAGGYECARTRADIPENKVQTCQ
jgi:hypothetical protein